MMHLLREIYFSVPEMSKFYANNLHLQDRHLGTISGALSTSDSKEHAVTAWIPESRTSTDILIKPSRPRLLPQVGKRNKHEFLAYYAAYFLVMLKHRNHVVNIPVVIFYCLGVRIVNFTFSCLEFGHNSFKTTNKIHN
jgi:hypothetical protein